MKVLPGGRAPRVDDDDDSGPEIPDDTTPAAAAAAKTAGDREALGKLELQVVGDDYRLQWACGIEAELGRLREHRDGELGAEVAIRSSRAPRAGMLHFAHLNLMSTQSRGLLAKALEKRDGDLDWPALIETMCFVVVERYRNGEPAIDLRFDLDRPPQRWRVKPFVESEGGAVLFADGGTGKSLIATAIAVTASSDQGVLGVRHGPVQPTLYLDWEAGSLTAQERLDAIAAGAAIRERPPVYYRRMSASLAEAAPNLRREIAELGVGLVIVDSLGAARAGEPESAEVTIRLFNAARSLGVPWLGIDHVTKQNGNDSTRPFGSTYTHNLARMTWSADKAQQEGEDAFVISLTNRKRNNGRLLPRMGFRVECQVDEDEQLRSVRFSSADLTSVPGLAERLPMKQRIEAELRAGALAPGAIAEALGEDVRKVGARLTELRRSERVVKLGDGTYALRAHSEASA